MNASGAPEKTLWRVCCAVAVLAASQATAEEPTPSAAPPRPEYFETATVRARPLGQATASVTVMDREQIEALAVSSAAELLRFIPGLNLIGGGARGSVGTGQIRGGDPNFTVVLLDGVPLNDATDTFGGSVNLHSLPTAHLERVEIVRGALSSFFGSAGLAGVVNLITRRGEQARHVVTTEIAGGNAGTRQGAVSVAAANDRRDYFIGASWEEERRRIADDAFEQLNLQGNLTTRVGRQAAFGLAARAASWSARDYPEGSGGPALGSGDTRTSDHDEFSLGLTWQSARTAPDDPADGRRSHRVRATLYRHELARRSPAIGFTVPPSVENTDYTTLTLGWSVPLIQNARTRLNVGAEIEREDGANRGFLDLPPAFGGRTDAAYDIRRDSAGAYAEWIVERGAWLFELGGRLDVPEGFDTEASPRAGIAWRPGGGATRLTASVGRSFKLPSFFALASPPALGGNPALRPEISLGGDVGIERRFDAAGVTASLTGFYNRFEDLIDFDFASFMNINRDDVESRGAELALAWIPASDLELHVSMTEQRVEDRLTGERLRHRPEHSGSARLIWRAGARVGGQVDGRWVSQMPDEQIPEPGRRTVPGTPLYGAALRVGLSARVDLGLRVDNLTDRDYETFIGFPGPGRSFRISLRRVSGER